MPISRYGEGYVMTWGYFNSKGLGDFIRMHSILDPLNNCLLKIKICLPLWELREQRGVYTYAPCIFMENIYLFTIHYSFTKQFGVLKGWIFPH